MICKRGYFNQQQKNNKSIDEDLGYTFEDNMNITIDLSNSEKRQEIDLKKERMVKLINKIKKIDKSFNADEYLTSTRWDYNKQNYSPEGK